MTGPLEPLHLNTAKHFNALFDSSKEHPRLLQVTIFAAVAGLITRAAYVSVSHG